MKQTLLRYLSAGVLATSALSAQADIFQYPEIKEDRPGGFTITPMIGQFNFDSDRDLDDEGYAGIGIGYRFSSPYMLEFVYANADATTTGGVDQGDVRQYRLEMLYDTGDIGNWSPYIAVGAASTEFGDNATVVDDEGAMTLGFGARYNFSQRVALRGDARYIRGVGDSKGADVLWGLGLQIFLGKTVAAPAPVAEPVAVVEPVGPTFAELCAEVGGVVDGESCVKTSTSIERVELNVQFKNNSDQVLASYLPEVERLATFMNDYPTSAAEIEGHTDSKGSSEYNQDLSQRRVNEVARLLNANYGISTDRLTAVGFGEGQPIATNDTVAGRAQNRRVVASMTVQIEETIDLDVKK
jgi:OOP family OmpA-OmpF porin